MMESQATDQWYDWTLGECALNYGLLGYWSMIWLERWRMWLEWRNLRGYWILGYWSIIWLDCWRMWVEWRETWATDQWSMIWLDRWRLWRLWLNLRLLINYMTGSLMTVATDQLYDWIVDDCGLYDRMLGTGKLYDGIVDDSELYHWILGYWSILWLDRWRLWLIWLNLRLLIHSMTGSLMTVTCMPES